MNQMIINFHQTAKIFSNSILHLTGILN
jgi:hypothetical protein